MCVDLRCFSLALFIHLRYIVSSTFPGKDRHNIDLSVSTLDFVDLIFGTLQFLISGKLGKSSPNMIYTIFVQK